MVGHTAKKMMYRRPSPIEPAAFKVNDSQKNKGNLIIGVRWTEPTYCTQILNSCRWLATEGITHTHTISNNIIPVSWELWNHQAKEIDRLTTEPRLSLCSFKFNPSVLSPALWQPPCYSLPSLTHISSESHRSSTTSFIVLSQAPTSAGVPWEPTDHSGHGSKQANLSSPLPQFFQVSPRSHPQICSRTSTVSLSSLIPISNGQLRSSLPTVLPKTHSIIPASTPAGIPWEPVGHFSQGSRKSNCRSSLFPPLLQIKCSILSPTLQQTICCGLDIGVEGWWIGCGGGLPARHGGRNRSPD